MGAVKRNKCRNCGDLFVPDARNRGRQKYCFKPACRKASKAASQRQWLNKPENQDYFRCPDNVRRVQQWRNDNPGYRRRQKQSRTVALQDSLNAQAIENTPNIRQNALQDVLIMQPTVLIGLIANFTGIAWSHGVRPKPMGSGQANRLICLQNELKIRYFIGLYRIFCP